VRDELGEGMHGGNEGDVEHDGRQGDKDSFGAFGMDGHLAKKATKEMDGGIGHEGVASKEIDGGMGCEEEDETTEGFGDKTSNGIPSRTTAERDKDLDDIKTYLATGMRPTNLSHTAFR
jgi:hypothetical protein